MRHYVTFLGLALAFAALPLNDAVAQDSKVESADKPSAKRTDEAVTNLLQTQLQAAQKAYRGALDTMAVQQMGGLLVQVESTKARPDLAYIWSVRWMQAQRDLSATKEERIAALMDHQKRMKDLLTNVKIVVGDGRGGILRASEVPAAEWYLAEADLWLLKEQQK
jgi:glucose/arabinose dehydrogenase